MLRHPSPSAAALALALAFSLAPTPAAGDGPGPAGAGGQWALIVAVGKHAEPRDNLRFTLADARLLRDTLVRRGGVSADHVLMMTDESPEDTRPGLANLRRELPRFLDRPGPADRVVVFFSGHGVGQGGTTYLIPADGRTSDLPGTALPVSEVSEALRRCKAGVKFLILDSCHSGGAKSPPPAGTGEPSAESVARDAARGRVPGCVILASCKADEVSHEWAERGQGLFTYWLARALEGGADTDGDGRLTADEVYMYTYDRVKDSSVQVFGPAQTPVRVIGGDVEGVPVVLSLLPEPPETVCRRLAAHLDLEARRRGLKKVGVLEFGKPGGGGAETLARANLPAYCAGLIRTELAALARSAYRVADEAAGKGFRVDDVGDPRAMRTLADRAGGMDAVVFGTLRRRGGNLHLLCDLMSTADGVSLVTPSGVFPLSEALILDDASADVRRRPDGGQHAPQVVRFAEDQARLGHPLLDNDFPYRVEVWSVVPRPGETIGPQTRRVKKDFINPPAAAGPDPQPRQLWVAAKDGEWFEVRVTNRSDQTVLMTLLVDGLNTLGQTRERLGQGWSWTLEPGKTHGFDGWWNPRTPTARPGALTDFDVRRFVFTDVASSVAGRQNFGESLGLITAGFFEAKPATARSLGVGAGPSELRQQRTSGFLPGRALGSVQIRYVDERELNDR